MGSTYFLFVLFPETLRLKVFRSGWDRNERARIRSFVHVIYSINGYLPCREGDARNNRVCKGVRHRGRIRVMLQGVEKWI